MNRLILLVESRIRGDVYVRFGGELPKTHRSNTAGRWMLSLLVNFARYIRIPGFYSWGYSDETCPPTSFYSAYNIIKAPKELYLLKETGHWRYPEQNIKVNQWLIDKLTGK